MKVQRVKILGLESTADGLGPDPMTKAQSKDGGGASASTDTKRVRRQRNRKKKLKLRDVTTDIGAKTDRILKEQEEERTDMLAFYLGETSLSDIGLDLNNAEDVNKWKGTKKEKKEVSKTRVQSIAEKIEKEEDDRDEMLKFYMGDSDAWEIGLGLDEVDTINQWRGLGEKKLTPTAGELAEYINRHEDDSERQERVRYYVGEIDVGETNDAVEGMMAKFVVETFDVADGDHTEVEGKSLADIESMIKGEIDDLVANDWKSESFTDCKMNRKCN